MTQSTSLLPCHELVIAFANGERVELAKLVPAIRLTELTTAKDDPLRTAVESAKQRLPEYRRELALDFAPNRAARLSGERVLAFIGGTLAESVATSTISTDIESVRSWGASYSFWELRLAEADPLYADRRKSEIAASQIVREAASERYQRYRGARRFADHERSKQSGSGKGGGKRK